MSLPDHPLDFTGRRVLVVGGSSGIGNGIARAFLARGASVAVWGTRASAADYAVESGSDLAGLDYASVDVADDAAVARAAARNGVRSRSGATRCCAATDRWMHIVATSQPMHTTPTWERNTEAAYTTSQFIATQLHLHLDLTLR